MTDVIGMQANYYITILQLYRDHVLFYFRDVYVSKFVSQLWRAIDAYSLSSIHGNKSHYIFIYFKLYLQDQFKNRFILFLFIWVYICRYCVFTKWAALMLVMSYDIYRPHVKVYIYYFLKNISKLIGIYILLIYIPGIFSRCNGGIKILVTLCNMKFAWPLKEAENI